MSRNKYFTAREVSTPAKGRDDDVGRGTRENGGRSGNETRGALVRRPPLNLKFLVVARIKLTLQQATTPRLRRRRVPTVLYPSAQTPALSALSLMQRHPLAHILHLITFLKYDPPDTNVDESAPLRRSPTPAGGAPAAAILYAKFHGPRKRDGDPTRAERVNFAPWKITRGISGPEPSDSFLFDSSAREGRRAL